MSESQRTIGRYRVVERIGRGGMGVLYRGVDPVLDREVAIKVMLADFAAEPDEEARTRFFREARAAARLQHRNIVTVFEFAEEEGVPYIVMEFLRGQTLAARLKTDPQLTLDQKLDIATELCTGLDFAHENGVVHRDVKPANVLLLADGTVKLLDFGIAKVASATLTRQGDVLGSAAYMAPEQISGAVVDGRADVFSVAVVLYEILAGRTPFESDSPTSTILRIMQEPPTPLDAAAIDVPVALVEAVTRGLQKNPQDRYQTASDFGAELQLIRMSLQSTGDTVFGGDAPFGETLFAPLPSQATVADDSPLMSAGNRQPSVVPAPAGKPVKRLWLAGTAAALVLVAGLGWLALSRTTALPAVESNTRAVEPAATPTPFSEPTASQSAPEAVLHVASDPDGARIDVDGSDTGLTTPADVPLGRGTPNLIRLTKKGFQPIESRLTSAVLQAGAVSYHLPEAETATVKVAAAGSYPFEVLDGKRLLSRAASSHELNVAPHRILRLRASAYLLDYPFKVDGGGGRAMQVQAPELGKLTIRSAMETCQVSVDGRDLGFPPINAQLVAAGTYSVQLKCPDGRTIRGTAITVVAGQTLIAKVP